MASALSNGTSFDTESFAAILRDDRKGPVTTALPRAVRDFARPASCAQLPVTEGTETDRFSPNAASAVLQPHSRLPALKNAAAAFDVPGPERSSIHRAASVQCWSQRPSLEGVLALSRPYGGYLPDPFPPGFGASVFAPTSVSVLVSSKTSFSRISVARPGSSNNGLWAEYSNM